MEIRIIYPDGINFHTVTVPLGQAVPIVGDYIQGHPIIKRTWIPDIYGKSSFSVTLGPKEVATDE